MADFQSIARKAVSDPAFLVRLKADPRGVLAEEGLVVTPDIEQALRALDAAAIERVVRQFADAKPGAAM